MDTIHEKNIMINDFGSIKIGEREIARIGIGSGAFFNSFTWGNQDINQSIAAIEAAIDCGLAFIDTGETYGKGASEIIIGKAVKKSRKKVYIASKISEETLITNDILKYEAACDRSLLRMKTDYIDLYQVHWMNPLINVDTVIEGLLLLKNKGKVKDVGICNCGKIYTNYFPEEYVTNQIPYSLLWRGMEYEFGNTLEKCNKTKLFYYCLGQGLLGTKYDDLSFFPKSRKRTRLFSHNILNAKHKEDGHEEALIEFLQIYHKLCREYKVLENHAAISWLLQRIENSLAIVGLRDAKQVKNLCEIEKISKEFIEELTLISNKLKNSIGCKLDLWDSRERIR